MARKSIKLIVEKPRKYSSPICPVCKGTGWNKEMVTDGQVSMMLFLVDSKCPIYKGNKFLEKK